MSVRGLNYDSAKLYCLLMMTILTLLEMCLSPVSPTLRDLKNSYHPEIRSLARAIPSIMIQDRAPNTIKKYVSSFSAWRKWAEARDINVLPTSGPEFSLYLVHLLQTTTSLASIQAAAFGVAWAHQKACFPSPLQHTMVKQLLDACKRILGTGSKNRKTPLTAARVKEVVLRFGQGNPSELQIACLIALGFAAFLRWDDLSNLKRANLQLTSDHMSIILTKRKNDQFREGSVILVARTGSPTCPVALTERLLLVGQHKESDYLFRKICHTKRGFSFRPQQLTYSRATELFKKQLKVIGLDPSQYGLHSLRSGGASTAAAAAIPDRLLMRHGGWRSQTAKNMYIKESEQALLQVSRALRL